MGHVDHGKTTLLDYIRKSNVAAREAGGITQGIGAYEITHTPRINADHTQNNAEKTQQESAISQRLTFIDTPGHEAFMKMRERGATIADIAILVVAADDGVQPQTKEAIRIIKEAELPYIVAINKIDKNNADIERVKTELLQNEVLLEGYGGSTSFQPISAKAGTGIEELLDLILLTAEVEGLTYTPTLPAEGFILEAKRDNKIGNIVTVIIKNGTLKIGDDIATISAVGKIKGLKNFLNESVKTLSPSSPAVILGFEALPAVGEEFTIGKKPAVPLAAKKKVLTGTDKSRLNFIIKANVAGSLEALAEAVKKLKTPDGKVINIVDEGVGEVTDGDAKLAVSTNATIIAFKVKITSAARMQIQAYRVPVFESEIIYELLEAIEKNFAAAQKQIVAGDLEILAVFDQKNILKQIVGGKVISGIIKNQSPLEVHRRNKKIGIGKLVNLQQGKKDMQEAGVGSECGMLVNADVTIAAGDHIITRSA